MFTNTSTKGMQSESELYCYRWKFFGIIPDFPYLRSNQ